MQNGFCANEEWPKQRPRVRRRHVNNEETKPKLVDFGSQHDLDDEMFQPGQTLSFDDVKVKVETNAEILATNSRYQMRKPPIPITYQKKSSSFTG